MHHLEHLRRLILVQLALLVLLIGLTVHTEEIYSRYAINLAAPANAFTWSGLAGFIAYLGGLYRLYRHLPSGGRLFIGSYVFKCIGLLLFPAMPAPATQFELLLRLFSWCADGAILSLFLLTPLRATALEKLSANFKIRKRQEATEIKYSKALRITTALLGMVLIAYLIALFGKIGLSKDPGFDIIGDTCLLAVCIVGAFSTVQTFRLKPIGRVAFLTFGVLLMILQWVLPIEIHAEFRIHSLEWAVCVFGGLLLTALYYSPIKVRFESDKHQLKRRQQTEIQAYLQKHFTEEDLLFDYQHCRGVAALYRDLEQEQNEAQALQDQHGISNDVAQDMLSKRRFQPTLLKKLKEFFDTIFFTAAFLLIAFFVLMMFYEEILPFLVDNIAGEGRWNSYQTWTEANNILHSALIFGGIVVLKTLSSLFEQKPKDQHKTSGD